MEIRIYEDRNGQLQTHSILFSLSPISTQTWTNLPGVANITSGLEWMLVNCFSIASPPRTQAILSPVNLSSSLQKRTLCMANYLVGLNTRALAPLLADLALSFSNMGMRKAAVFPDPVLAMATTSLPSMMRGTVFRWMGVGTL